MIQKNKNILRRMRRKIADGAEKTISAVSAKFVCDLCGYEI